MRRDVKLVKMLLQRVKLMSLVFDVLTSVKSANCARVNRFQSAKNGVVPERLGVGQFAIRELQFADFALY